jgi:nicotinamide-nucleotide amidase
VQAEILCVGSELLLGQIIDTNAAYIARQLARVGLDLRFKQTVGDNLERIAGAISEATSRSQVLVITGGLGPTTDDLTREAIAVSLGVPLVHVQRLEDELREFFASRNYTPGASLMRQAYLPEGSDDIPNTCGTAPGVFAKTASGAMIFAVPGVPREMVAMLDGWIVPRLLESMEGEKSIIVSRVLRAFGVGESSLADPIEDILTTAQNPTVAPLIYQNTEVHLRLTAKARDEEAAKVLLDEMQQKVCARPGVGEFIFGTDDETLPGILIRLLQERNETLAVAESLTGGLVQSLLTDVPGASQVLRGGVVAYNEDLKMRLLGVDAQSIEDDSVVSEAVAREMAVGARKVCGSNWAISTTGEAGPDSASGKPKGTVWLGLSGAAEERAILREMFGDRENVKKRAALWAIELLRRQILALEIS